MQFVHIGTIRTVHGINCILQLGPWLAVEIPDLVERGVVVHRENRQTKHQE